MLLVQSNKQDWPEMSYNETSSSKKNIFTEAKALTLGISEEFVLKMFSHRFNGVRLSVLQAKDTKCVFCGLRRLIF